MRHIPTEFLTLLEAARRVPMFEKVEHSCSDSELNDAVAACDSYVDQFKGLTGLDIEGPVAEAFSILNTSGHMELADALADQMATQLRSLKEVEELAPEGAPFPYIDLVKTLTAVVTAVNRLPTWTQIKGDGAQVMAREAVQAVEAMIESDLLAKSELAKAAEALGRYRAENSTLAQAFTRMTSAYQGLVSAVTDLDSNQPGYDKVSALIARPAWESGPVIAKELGRLSPDGTKMVIQESNFISVASKIYTDQTAPYGHWTPILSDPAKELELATTLKDAFLTNYAEVSRLYYDAMRHQARSNEFILKCYVLFQNLELDSLDLTSSEYKEARALHKDLLTWAEARRVEALSVLLDTGRNAEPQDRTLPDGWVMARADAYAILRATLARREAMDQRKDFDFNSSVKMFAAQSLKDTENYFTRNAARGLRNRQTE